MKVKTSDYYGVQRYYAYMPLPMFQRLESAYVNGQEYAEISASDYTLMQKKWREIK